MHCQLTQTNPVKTKSAIFEFLSEAHNHAYLTASDQVPVGTIHFQLDKKFDLQRKHLCLKQS